MITERGADQGREEGDSVLGAEGDETAGSPRDVVHHAVAAGAYEDPPRLHAPALSVGSRELLSGGRRHHERNQAPRSLGPGSNQTTPPSEVSLELDQLG